MIVLRNLGDLHRHTQALGRRSGTSGILVPTMGALHEGHAALIRHGAALSGRSHPQVGCIVSIFVNPTQFNQPSDYDRYPRTLDADLDLCRTSGATAVFAPDQATIYPPPPASPIPIPPLPAVASEPGLEDAFRPGHFAGVCQVVMRLFQLLEPAAAVFGEKDWQQLQVIRAMTEDSQLPIEIVPFPTIRAHDGMALSSRNRFLSQQDRAAALAISRSLCDAAAIPDPARAENLMQIALSRAGLRIEYAAIRNARTLLPTSGASNGEGRALIAAWAGSTRLIDNAPWPSTT
jgi:pantoate--beta-alanine ligase